MLASSYKGGEAARRRGKGHTNIGLAEETTSLGGRRRRWGALNLRRRRRARLAHAVGTMHLGGSSRSLD